jgi:hypothetical protein
MEPKNAGAGHPLGGSAPLPLAVPSLTDQWKAHLRTQRDRESAVTLLALPSGQRVRATRPSLLWLLGAGRVPDALAGPVQELIALGTVAAGEDGVAAEMGRQQRADPVGYAATFLAILDLVWCAAVIEPRFAADGDGTDPEALPVGAVALDDKTYLFVWAQGVDQSVAEFLDRKGRAAAALGAAPDGGRVRVRPGGAGRDRPEA